LALLHSAAPERAHLARHAWRVCSRATARATARHSRVVADTTYQRPGDLGAVDILSVLPSLVAVSGQRDP
jgi:hypothetical protein